MVVSTSLNHFNDEFTHTTKTSPKYFEMFLVTNFALTLPGEE